jgi:hypothetical protein
LFHSAALGVVAVQGKGLAVLECRESLPSVCVDVVASNVAEMVSIVRSNLAHAASSPGTVLVVRIATIAAGRNIMIEEGGLE